MRQRSYGRDVQLTFRMIFTMAMLLLLYIAFMTLLAWAGVPFVFILIISIGMAVFQYFMSDRLVLMTTGAKEVTAQEEP